MPAIAGPSLPSLNCTMFFITESDCGYTFYAETFATFDDACHCLDAMECEQDCAYSYARECAIAELKQQIVDFMAENTEP